ncbi:tripartite motif-containing protein 2-like isoform X5 [Penaeus chinensis]|uniref:tripartite motif-containing protein 2-like isoform X5 n=1 Tax=Penaeus chinensis TaxID=139456 RepID=UPI001FB63EF4|nr:tripartite motif-containing protein 2-like isoform X5 [Penaeus chinensis]
MDEEESLDCPVCFEQYNDGSRTPKMMTCLHTVCACCVLDLLGLGNQRQGASEPEIPKGQSVQCPICRQNILTDKMQTNRYIVAHLRHLIRLGSLDDGETQHKHAQATAPPSGENLDEDLWCRTCEEPARKLCIDHEVVPLLKGDEVTWIEELQGKQKQEEQDLALAVQLSEVSLLEFSISSESSSPAPASPTSPSGIVPVGRRQGVWKGMASSKAKKIEVSTWTYNEIRHAINTSYDPLLVKHCHKELQRRWKEYSRTMKKKQKKEKKKLR